MFLLKKIIAPLFLPVTFCSLLMIVGLILLWFTRRQKAGRLLVSAGSLLLILLSYGVSSKWLLIHLERQHPPILTAASLNPQSDSQAVKWIVVLGGGGSYSSQLPSTSQLSTGSLARLVEGIRLQRQIPGSKLILSEGNIFGSGPVAQAMGRVAEDLGVNKGDLVLETQSRDTESQAGLILPLVGSDRFLLVTSASHMPRSVALFRKLNMNPIAAPTDFESLSAETWRPSQFYPSAGGLRKSELAVHEYIGLAWAKLRGKI